MAFDNNFGASAGWELNARDLGTLSSYVDQTGDTSFDDLFDGPAYRAAQTTFAAQPHRMMPLGQTHYRPAVQHGAQGLPGHASTSHWDYLPGDSAQLRARETTHAGKRLAWAVAQDSARRGTPPPPRGGAPINYRAPPAGRAAPPRSVLGPSPRTFNFAG